MLIAGRQAWHLVVVGASGGRIGQRVVADQRQRLRADTLERDAIAFERTSGRRIDDLHRLAEAIERLREVAESLQE